MQRKVAVFGLILVSSFSLAGQTIKIKFPDAGAYTIFEAASWPVTERLDAKPLAGAEVSYDVSLVKPSDRLFIVQSSTGNAAAKTLGELKSGTWSVAASDFTIAAHITIKVGTPKGPLGAGMVTLKDSVIERAELVDSSTQGEANFWFVKAGEISVNVAYRADGVAAAPVKQVFSLSMTRTAPIATFELLLPKGETIVTSNSVPAVGDKSVPAANGPATGAGTPADPRKDAPAGQNNFPGLIVGLLIVGGLGYFAYSYFQKNPATIKQVLQQAGVPVDGAVAEPGAGAIAPTALRPEPLQTIQLSGAQVDPVTPATTAAHVGTISQSGIASTSTPQLQSADGSIYEITEGETTIGREFGVNLVIPHDTISRKHASLIRSGGKVTVSDSGSTNGTYVDGAKVTGPTELRIGQSVRFGSVAYTFYGG